MNETGLHILIAQAYLLGRAAGVRRAEELISARTKEKGAEFASPESDDVPEACAGDARRHACRSPLRGVLIPG